jgi:ABC-2 type transport system ATP-binding protein
VSDRSEAAAAVGARRASAAGEADVGGGSIAQRRSGEAAPPKRSSAPAVEVESLLKRYPKASSNAVDGISFSVAPSEVFALLGPNGAGKTTTVGMLTTRIRPDSGVARIAGVDVLAEPVLARSRLAVVPQRSNLDRALSIRNNLVFHAAYHGVPRALAGQRADALLEQFGLAERASVKPDLFSGGQAQRVMIARALMHKPEVLFLDEPSTGLDPAARLFLWDRLRELRDEGVTLILTTHDMAEAAELSNRVAIIDHGRVLALDTPAQLVRSLPGSTTLELVASAQNGAGVALVDALGQLAGVERVERVEADPSAPPEQLRLRLYVAGEAPELLAPVASALSSHDATLSAVEVGTPTLEDVFIHLTGRTLR